MLQIRPILALLVTTFVYVPHAFAGDDLGNEAKKAATCSENYHIIRDNIYKPNKDIDNPNNQQAMVQSESQQVASSFRSMRKEDLEKVFEGPEALTFDEIDALYFAIKSGKIKTKPGLFTFVKVFRDLGYDHPSLFNGKSDTVERMLAILGNSYRRANLIDVSGDALKAVNNLRLSTENLIAQGMSEMRGRGNQSTRFLIDGYANLFSPHYDRIKEIVGFQTDLLKILNLTYIADEPVAYSLNTLGDKLLSNEKDVLNALLNDTRGKIQTTLDVIKDAYNNDMVSGSAVQIGDLRLRAIEKKLEELKSGDKLDDAVEQAEQDMDKVEEALLAQRKRDGFDDLDYASLHERHTQIRFDQHVRETKKLDSQYHGLTNDKVKGTDYTVQAEWTVTVKHEETHIEYDTVYEHDDKGNVTGSHQVPRPVTTTWNTSYDMEEKFTLKADYDELLNGKITPSESEVDSMLPPAQMRGSDAVSASNGSPTINWVDDVRTAQILAAAKPVMDLENEVRLPLIKLLKQFDEWIDKYDNARTSNTARDAMLGEMDQILKQMTDVIAASAKSYASLSESGLKQKWAIADYKHYQARSQKLVERNQELITRLKFFRAEVQHQVEDLGIYTRVPDYSKQLELIKKITTQTQVKSGVRHTIGVAIIGLGLWVYNTPSEMVKVRSHWNALTEWWSSKFGSGDNGDPSMIYTEGEGMKTQVPENKTPVDPTKVDQAPKAKDAPAVNYRSGLQQQQQ